MPLNRSTLTFTIETVDDGEGVTLAEIRESAPPRIMSMGITETIYEPVPTVTAAAKRHPNDSNSVALGRNLAIVRALRKVVRAFEDELPEDCRDADPAVVHITKRFHQMNQERQHWRDRYAELTEKVGYPMDGNDPDSNLVRHAQREMSRIGLYAPDADYGGMLAQAVEDLIRMFAAQGHSGGSAFMVRELFNQLTNFEPLSPLTDDPSEWMHIEEGMAGSPDLYQSRRRPDAFSNDGGKTYRLVGDTDDTTYTSEPHTPPEVADAPHAAEPAS